MPVSRTIAPLIRRYAREFRSLAIVGPRQDGKTTLARMVFADKPYISLENPENRAFAEDDTLGFLARFPDGAVIDEAQRVPAIFNYLQQLLDESNAAVRFILTGNNFLLLQNISQSLAGRIGYADLLLLSLSEIIGFGKRPLSTDTLILQGGYPEIYQEKRKPRLWHSAYVRTYVERDVRQISNVADIRLFTKFLRLCAGRVALQLNASALSIAAGGQTSRPCSVG